VHEGDDEELEEDGPDDGDVDAFSAGAAEDPEGDGDESGGEGDDPDGPHGVAEGDHDDDGAGGVGVDEVFAAAGESFEEGVDDGGGEFGSDDHGEDAPAEDDDGPEQGGDERELHGEIKFAARDGPDDERRPRAQSGEGRARGWNGGERHARLV